MREHQFIIADLKIHNDLVMPRLHHALIFESKFNMPHLYNAH